MAFRFLPGQNIRDNVKQVATEQIDRALARLSGKGKNGNAVHETRKALKRLRSLLHLIKPAMRKSDFQRDESRLKLIARSLSGVRDIQAMIETLAKLEVYDEVFGKGGFAQDIRSDLEARRNQAEKALNGAQAVKARKLLKEARKDFEEIVIEHDDFKDLAITIERDYRKAKLAFQHAYECREDEAFHDWRKYVQRHWRQVLLVVPCWPRALRPHTALARELSEVLGEDHDIYMLAKFLETQETSLGGRRDRDDFFALCAKRQNELRDLAHDMGLRLFSEKPSSLAARLIAYWDTASRLEAPEPTEQKDGAGNVVRLKSRRA